MGLSHSFVKWSAGHFDGDGCVSFQIREEAPIISIGQNSTFTRLYFNAFGGSLFESSKTKFCSWTFGGLQSYFLAQLWKEHTVKKSKELDAVIRYHEGCIDFSQYIEEIRYIKKFEYPYKEYDLDLV